MDEEVQEEIERAARDKDAAQLRKEFGTALAAALRAGGKVLWIGGAMIGPDRDKGDSSFDFGHDGVVGLATVMQIGGELVGGAIALFGEGNRYAAAALTRQLVEAEYLAWAFAEADEDAEKWMRSSKGERQEMWQPRHIRERAEGRFRGVDYGLHCGKGGHPSPEGIHLLPGHYTADASEPLWFSDMVIHGHSVWDYSQSAAERLGQADVLGSLDEVRELAEIESRWRELDPFLAILRRHTQRRSPLAEILLGLRQEREAEESSAPDH